LKVSSYWFCCVREKIKMFTPKFTITNKINNFLLEIERARGFLEAISLLWAQLPIL